jgi:hypothetical protein
MAYEDFPFLNGPFDLGTKPLKYLITSFTFISAMNINYLLCYLGKMGDDSHGHDD